MSTAVTVGSVKFVSVKEAAQSSSYSRDYISRLARDEKIVATQINRQWYVDPVSLSNFVEATKLEKEIRGQRLRDERKREQLAAASRTAVEVVALENKTYSRSRAQLATVAVMLCGICLGLIVHVATETLAPVDNTSSVAQLPSSLQSTSNNAVSAADEAESLKVVTSGVRPLQAEEGILLLPKELNPSDTTQVAELFSDTVELTYVSPNEGVVTAQFGSESGTEISFVTVPVKTNGTTSQSATYE